MKRRKQHDIVVLLSSLLVFSLCIGCFFAVSDAQEEDVEFKPLTTVQLLEQLAPLIDSGSIQMVSSSLYPFIDPNIKGVITTLVQPESNRLSNEQKQHLILDLLGKTKDAAEQGELIQLLLPLEKTDPALYGAAKFEYDTVIPVLLAWLGKNPERLKEWVTSAFAKTIDAQRLDVYSRLIADRVPLTQNEAQDLLWRVIENKSDSKFISELVKQGATVHTSKNGRSPLIRAVEQGEYDVVLAILQEGANVNAMADPIVGTALQRAIELNEVSIEMLLRSYGAQE